MAEIGYLIPAEAGSFEKKQYDYNIIPNVFNFGNVTEQTTEPTTSIQVTNTGTDSLSFTFTDSTNFYTNDVGFTLTSGQTQSFIINAKTDIVGLHLETIFVNEINVGNKSIALSINILQLPQFQYSVNPLTWDFGTHDEGDIPPSKEIIITAEGTQPISFTFTDSTNFYTDDVGFTLTQGQSQGFLVKALTDNIGIHNEFMSINQVEAGNSNLALQSEILEVPFTSGQTIITASGNFDVPVGTTLLEYTIVAGGGGGGGRSGDRVSGGGGAGGMLEGSISNPTAGLTAVVIGAGGAGGSVVGGEGGQGGTSSILGLTAVGGGGGGGGSADSIIRTGKAGGSGGGGGLSFNLNANGGAGSQGNNGATSQTNVNSGGGGGAGSAGAAPTAGSGSASSINGVVYATGGAGRPWLTVTNPIATPANTGNGGRAVGSNAAGSAGGSAGGSGVVVLRWTNP